MNTAATVDNVLAQAAVFAGQAPSIHNSQPWLWRIDDDALDLMLDHRRLLHIADPHARFAILSCGAALHHARIDLAALGWHAVVARFPEHGAPDRLARLQLDGRAPVDPVAARLVQATASRRTDRRSIPSAPLDYDKLRPIESAIRAEGADLRLLRPRQVFDLAEAVDQAGHVEREDPDRQRELARWIGPERSPGTGIPARSLPGDLSHSIAPERCFRRPGGALVEESRRHASVFAILHGRGDEPLDWLHAGEALSAGWLTATRLDVSVLPLSVAIEMASTRAMIQRMLTVGWPFLVLRFAAAAAGGENEPRTPRLPADVTVETAAPGHPYPGQPGRAAKVSESGSNGPAGGRPSGRSST
jgi:hypothetical protein